MIDIRAALGFLRTIMLACLACVPLSTTGPAAQTLEGPFVGAGSNLGGVTVVPDGGTTFIDVNDDGDFATPPVRYNLTSLAPELVGRTNYFLSPSRTILYVLQDNTQMAIPSQAWFAELDGTGSAITILHGPIDLSTGTAGSRRLFGPAWYDAPGVQQIAYFVLGLVDGTDLQTLVVDMNTSGLSGRARIGLRSPWQNASDPFSPAGDFLAIRDDISDTDLDGNTDFRIIPLCGDDFGMPARVEIPSGTFPALSTGNVMNGMVDVLFTSGQTVVDSVTFDDCYSGNVMPPARGACCVFSGSQLADCFEDLTEAECNLFPELGSFNVVFGANMTCDQTCPSASVEVSATAPNRVQAPGLYNITFELDNDSGAAATTVGLRSSIPFRSSFAGASDGGAFVGGEAVWTDLGPIPAGTTTTVTMTLSADCTDIGRTFELPGANYRVTFDGMSRSGSRTALTLVEGPNTGPIEVAVSSAPDREPLLEGDRVTHTVTLTNPGNEELIDMRLTSNGSPINAGRFSVIDQVINDGNGLFELNPGSTGFIWTGRIPAMDTVTLQFTTLVECVTGGSRQLEYVLNDGRELTAQDPCNIEVGSATPTAVFEITSPLSASLVVTNVQPGVIGPATSLEGTTEPGDVGQLVRSDTAIELEYTVTNTQTEALAEVNLTSTLPEAFVVMNPPFIGTPPAGFTWDDAARTLSFTGSLDVGETVVAEIAAFFSPSEQCDSTFLSNTVDTGGSCVSARSVLALWPIPELTTNDRLYVLDPFRDGIAAIEIVHGMQMDFERFFCSRPEVYSGLAVTEDGTLVIVGLPAYELNPDTLDFRVITRDVVQPALDPNQFWAPDSVAQVPGTDRVFLTTFNFQAAGDTIVALDVGGQAITAYDDPNDVRVTPGGAIDADGDFYTTLAGGDDVLVLPTSGPLPAPAGSGALIPVPVVDYPTLGALGAVSSRDWGSIGNGPDGTVVGLVTTTLGAGDSASLISALVQIDAAGQVDVIEPLFSGAQFQNAPPFPPGTTFVTNRAISRTVFAPAPDGRVYIDAQGTGLFSYNFNTGEVIDIFGAGQSAGIAYDPGVPGCPEDFDGNGIYNINDVQTAISRVQARDASMDLNKDGTVDWFDLALYLLRLNGCPA